MADPHEDPFLTLVVEALNLMHPRFARGGAQADGDESERSRPYLLEFYHQFRHLWDRGIPVGLGLGHVIVQADPLAQTRPSDICFWRIGESGQPNSRLGVVSITCPVAEQSSPVAPQPDTVAAELIRMSQLRYPHAVAVLVGQIDHIQKHDLPKVDGVATVLFDTDIWAARILS